MIVVWKPSPGVNPGDNWRDGCQQSAAKCLHPFRRMTNMRHMVQTRRREMISANATDCVRRTVPRKWTLFAPGQQRGALLYRELSPEIGHDSRGPENWMQGERVCPVRSAGFSLSESATSSKVRRNRLKPELQTGEGERFRSVRSAGFILSLSIANPNAHL